MYYLTTETSKYIILQQLLIDVEEGLSVCLSFCLSYYLQFQKGEENLNEDESKGPGQQDKVGFSNWYVCSLLANRKES